MKNGHKVVKYFAYALAILIIVSIIQVATVALNWFTSDTTLDTPIKTKFEVTNTEITELNIIVDSGEIEIKNGDFAFETNDSNITANIYDGRLTIEDDSNKHFSFNGNNKIIIYIPKNYMFNTSMIKTGAAKLNIEELNVKKLKLEIGAGKAVIKKLNVEEKLDLETGAGSTQIKNAYVKNLYSELGVGYTSFTGIIEGDPSITCGVGELNLKLKDSEDNYKFRIKKGLGSINLNEDKVSDGTYGNGTNFIDVEGGIGSVSINFINENSK